MEGAVFCTHCGSMLQMKCQRCQAVNPLGSRFCHSCGSALAEGTVEAASAGQEPLTTTAATGCPRCRTTNEPGSVYCYRCGYPLQQKGGGVPARGEPMGFWIRTAAYLLDSFLIGVVAALVVLAFANPFDSSAAATSDVIWEEQLAAFQTRVNWTSAGLGAVYFTALVAVWRATLGKRILGMQVVRMDSSRVGPVRAFLRYGLYYLSAFAFLIGFIMIALREDKRGLHDLICDTRVVKR